MCDLGLNLDRLIPVWDEKYSINDAKIDTQHKKLFELAGKVENAVFKFVKRDELKEILSDLFSYMKEHFANEEQYMDEIEYPYIAEHKVMHKIIIKDMSHLIQHIKTTNDLKEKLYTIMSDWLLEHILHHDMMIGNWLNEKLSQRNENILDDEDFSIDIPQPNDVLNTQPTIKETQFIYSCPCHQTHILSYAEHLEILCHNKILRCKKCQKNLFYTKSEIIKKRIADVSKMG